MTFGEFRRNCDNAYYDLMVFNAIGIRESVSMNLEIAADRAAAMNYDGALISRFRAGVVEMAGETRPLLEVELYV